MARLIDFTAFIKIEDEHIDVLHLCQHLFRAQVASKLVKAFNRQCETTNVGQYAISEYRFLPVDALLLFMSYTCHHSSLTSQKTTWIINDGLYRYTLFAKIDYQSILDRSRPVLQSWSRWIPRTYQPWCMSPTRDELVRDPQAPLHQDYARESIIRVIRNRVKGTCNKSKPSIIKLCGLSGHGKSELAKWVHQVLFGDQPTKKQKSYFYVNMATMNDRLDSSQLFGASVGTEGSSNSKGSLISFLADVHDHHDNILLAHTSCVIVLDEVDKGHKSIITQLMQLFDEGYVKDANENTVFSISKAVIILLLNNPDKQVFLDPLIRTNPQALQQDIQKANMFFKEVICNGNESVYGRLGGIQPIMAFTDPMVHDICKHMLSQTIRELRDTLHLDISYAPELLDHMTRHWIHQQGARSIADYDRNIREVMSEVEVPVIMPILYLLEVQLAIPYIQVACGGDIVARLRFSTEISSAATNGQPADPDVVLMAHYNSLSSTAGELLAVGLRQVVCQVQAGELKYASNTVLLDALSCLEGATTDATDASQTLKIEECVYMIQQFLYVLTQTLNRAQCIVDFNNGHFCLVEKNQTGVCLAYLSSVLLVRSYQQVCETSKKFKRINREIRRTKRKLCDLKTDGWLNKLHSTCSDTNSN